MYVEANREWNLLIAKEKEIEEHLKHPVSDKAKLTADLRQSSTAKEKL